ncbi:MAG TPA: vitamin K epoxide reductase family protein [Kofleriaceae bacterium]
MRPPGWLVAVLVGALAGLVFAGVSTYDFVQHLDRQVHSLHCSFIPGAGAEAGSSGCQAAMMSPYSSVFRTTIWGGIPISLPAMAVFAFILFYGVDLLLSRRTNDTRATAFLALACSLPALASVTMLIISLTKVGSTCKLCVGIYIASALALTGAIMLWRRAVGEAATQPEPIGTAKSGGTSLEAQVEEPRASNGWLASMFGVGVAFVAVPVILYFVLAPDHGKFIGTCGQLDKPDDTYGVFVPVQRGGKTPALEVLDPLCPACKAFEQRLESSGLADRLDRRAILFPLDTTCNWMITENTHPGACTVSEAVLCAGDNAPAVIKWAFEVQDRVRTETKADPTAAERIVKQRWPELAACVGSPEAKSRLNKSLRWSVANNIRVLTPQLFVDNVKLCDEDVDLGLDYALSRMLDGDMPNRVHTAKPVESTPGAPGAGATGNMPTYQGEKPSPAETNPPATAAQPTEAAPAGTQPAGTQPAGTQPAGTPPAGTPTEAKPAEDKPVTSPTPPADKPAAKPADKPADKPAMPAEEKPAPAPEPAPPAAGGDQGGGQ